MILNIKHNRFYFILLSILIIFSDQFTKNLIIINYKSIINNNLLLFSIDYVKNYGAAFNILSGSRIFLSTVSIVISLFLIYFILYKKNISNIDLLSFSFIMGGTIGNGIDRITRGYVIDFINLNLINFPVFNIADISINIGLIIIIYGYIKNKR
ncbi:signal peptidase II [Prochlorococcus sp. AH-716-K03]|nr:signal peptidase II [Prochlorococcus sp. AH-716-K03]